MQKPWESYKMIFHILLAIQNLRMAQLDYFSKNLLKS